MEGQVESAQDDSKGRDLDQWHHGAISWPPRIAFGRDCFFIF